MSALDTVGDDLPPDTGERTRRLREAFETAWAQGSRPRIEDFLPAEGAGRRAPLMGLAKVELDLRLRAWDEAHVEEYLGRFPELARDDGAVWELLRVELDLRRGPDPEAAFQEACRRFPRLGEQLRGWLAEQVALATTALPAGSESARTGPLAAADAEGLPQRLGRYRVEALLGSGGFGKVYKAYDEGLRRDVAVKVAHPTRLSRPEDAEEYLAEARVLAGLDHPHIVPVYDLGRAEDGRCYVVTKFIEGTDLRARIEASRPAHAEAAELVAAVAEALHYAHRQGLVHRDVKPANILLDPSGRPYVADFGLALREEDLGKGPGFAGTVPYMSPEQAAGEGHRVDGRSDVFSLGVVLYELLTGRRPFRGDTATDVLVQITTGEPKPPRQVDDGIPKELERVCLKALARRASERYTTAKDMADDLRHWSAAMASPVPMSASPVPMSASPVPMSASPVPLGPGGGTPSFRPLLPALTGPGSPSLHATPPALAIGPAPRAADSSQPLRVVPKGLRAFEARDADFFLELLPGPRDRDGMPESLRFWKGWVEETDPDTAFPVGLLYGPSGCGKSSLVKAGLLSRLARHVRAVYVEATAGDTEARLLRGLRKVVPDLPAGAGLKDALASVRRGPGLGAGVKVLVVLDQFEQWLHAHPEEETGELVQALRQCDGKRLQALLLVRDDFWMAATRFLRQLEVRLFEGKNSAPVDLFDRRHARRVLAAFGRAFGALSDSPAVVTREQDAFLDRAVDGLARDGKVVPVRLALFAEIVKGKPWTPATLKQAGGMEGVGVTFLEETFAAPGAPPPHRLHQKAAQAVLNALLPEAGTAIKGNMRSRQQLLEASSYANRPADFEDLLRVLDGELRLITPTDPEGHDEGEPGGGDRRSPTTRFYQLTHDYLVPSLRDWLTRKQKETRRGRAELLLTDRAAVWNARPESRQLPSLWQFAQIRWLTAPKSWTPPQQKMMRRAGRYHAVRGLAAAVLLVAAFVTGLALVQQRQAAEGAGLVKQLLRADTAQVPTILTELAEYRRWTDPLLREENIGAAYLSRERLNTSLALLPTDPSQVEYLNARLLDAAPAEVAVIRDALAGYHEPLVEAWWAVVEQPDRGKELQRLRAGAALAKYDPGSARWDKDGSLVVHEFVRENFVALGQWSEAYRPVMSRLLKPLAEVYRDPAAERTGERTVATNILADYATDKPALLADLIMDADDKQFPVIFAKLRGQRDAGWRPLADEIDKQLPAALASSDQGREALAKRQANAAVALLRMNQPEKAWQLLKHSRDPRARSYLIHRLSPLGAEAGAVIKRLDEETNVGIRRALLLALGEFTLHQLPASARASLIPRLRDLYRADSDPGLHAAAEWLLRRWQQEAWLKQVNGEWARDRKQRSDRFEAIGQILKMEKEKAPPQWYVNCQSQTMVVIPGPVEFAMGSPQPERGRTPYESQHNRRIGRTFALSAMPVTLEQYQRFAQVQGDVESYAPSADCPMIGTTWFQAAEYCNWLSRQEGLPPTEWCYEPVVDVTAVPALLAGTIGLLGGVWGEWPALTALFPGRLDPEFKAGMRLAPDYLRRIGYRLPTEAEVEYATRAGAVTSRYFGETAALLPHYGWYEDNSPKRVSPVGGKKPNDLGLFDAHGNVFTWCQVRFRAFPQGGGAGATEDNEDTLIVTDEDERALRGGSFNQPAQGLRAAYRYKSPPTNGVVNVGFRLARTWSP